MSARRAYATNISVDEWETLEPLVPPAKPGGERTVDSRDDYGDDPG